MLEQNTTPIPWFGLTEDREIICVGTFATIDEADESPKGQNCTVLFDEDELRDLYDNIAGLLS